MTERPCTCGGRHPVWSGNPGGHAVSCPSHPDGGTAWVDFGTTTYRPDLADKVMTPDELRAKILQGFDLTEADVGISARPSWDEYGLALAKAVALRADCSRRQVGAVILAEDGRVVSTGYNGAPAGEPGCASAGACPRARQQPLVVPSADYEASACIAIHAEMNAVIYAGRDRCEGATLYCTDEPCYLCLKVIKAAGIDRVVVA